MSHARQQELSCTLVEELIHGEWQRYPPDRITPAITRPRGNQLHPMFIIAPTPGLGQRRRRRYPTPGGFPDRGVAETRKAPSNEGALLSIGDGQKKSAFTSL